MPDAPAPQAMDREGKAPPTRRGLFTAVFCPCIGDVSTAGVRFRRQELVFYDSAKARRTLCGKVHYCLACPGWSKITTQRVVYSRWDLVPLQKVPGECCDACCDCGGNDSDWLPPDPTTMAEPTGDGCSVPCGRTLDTFDADIIVDASAHQTLCQICRGEGDLVLYRKAGADLSDPSQIFVLPDVVAPFDVFNDVTFELSKINLQGARNQALGARMGATVWNFDARSGADGPRSKDKAWRGPEEFVYYDSLTARRTCLGHLCSLECCLPPIYKVTSERVLYTQWDMWFPCEEPLSSATCCLCWAGRGVARECCCALGASAAAAERLKAAASKAAQPADAPPAACRCCALPIGRTAHYFDIDIVADVRPSRLHPIASDCIRLHLIAIIVADVRPSRLHPIASDCIRLQSSSQTCAPPALTRPSRSTTSLSTHAAPCSPPPPPPLLLLLLCARDCILRSEQQCLMLHMDNTHTHNPHPHPHKQLHTLVFSSRSRSFDCIRIRASSSLRM